MRVASWIVTSHHRPELLAATLEHLREAAALGHWPFGWQYELVVAHAADDRASADVAHRAGAIVVPTTQPHPSGKRNAALSMCSGELVMTTDDDDFQSMQRPRLAIEAYIAGHKLSGIREFRRLYLASGNVVRYCGRGISDDPRPDYPDIPPVLCGTARNYAREMLKKYNGWDARLSELEDHDLHRRITKRRGSGPGITDRDLGDALAASTIILQHDSNIISRPDVPKGKRMIHGWYYLIGEGHWSELPDFPQEVAQRLQAIGRL